MGLREWTGLSVVEEGVWESVKDRMGVFKTS